MTPRVVFLGFTSMATLALNPRGLWWIATALAVAAWHGLFLYAWLAARRK